MKGKFALAVGLTAGYILGARAGRKRYEQIQSVASKVWETKLVQSGVDTAREFAAERGNEVRQFVGTAVGNAIARPARKTSKSAPSKSTATKSSSASTAASSSGGSTAKKSTSTAKKTGAKKSSSTAKKS